MDGFYVAKIQKLSDKLPEDTFEEPSEVPVKDEAAMKVEKGKDGDKETKHERGKKGKKRTTEDDRIAEKRRKKSSKISFPPVQKQALKKKKLNAKVTKPRRRKVADSP
jgi:hypothetical protein